MQRFLLSDYETAKTSRSAEESESERQSGLERTPPFFKAKVKCTLARLWL